MKSVFPELRSGEQQLKEAPTARPTVSVIIPTLNEARNLPYALNSVPSWVDEVVIADGNSKDDTERVARVLWPDVKIVHDLIVAARPSLVVTHDFVNAFGAGDHPDHYATGGFVKEATRSYDEPHELVGVLGYPVKRLAANLTAEERMTKAAAFNRYARKNGAARFSREAHYALWLERAYDVARETRP